MIQKDNKQSFLDSLQQILILIKDAEEVKMRQILNILSTKGYAALLIIFSLPFCIPIQIPGFSIPFGAILGFIALQIIFDKQVWWPKWILEKKVKTQAIENLIKKTMDILQWVQKFVHPRFIVLAKNSFFHHLNGILILILAILLSLPLPIPMTNLLSAFPILCIGLGIMEDDGFFILLGYVFALIDIIFFCGLFLFGFMHIKVVLSS